MKNPLSRSIRAWLFGIWTLILMMVIVGGTTRLTGSGLSMVEWHPLMGTLPPLSERAWSDVFARYQEFPQYQQVNQWMGLSDFKRIFFWEYLHRLLGRLIGVAFFVPWLVFVFRRQLDRRWTLRTFVAFVLGGSQGLLGWYMVKSGLIDHPEVSHLRLAAHLSLAFLVGQYVLWLLLDASPPAPSTKDHPKIRHSAWAFVGLLALQVIWGAFMAGTRAGLISSTFPDMNGSYGPGLFFTGESILADAINNPLAIHWTHRALGWVIAIAALWLAFRVRATGESALRRPARLMVHLVALQFVLGVFTVVLQVPTAVAVAHQACAYLLLSAAIWLCHRAAPPLPEAQDGAQGA